MSSDLRRRVEHELDTLVQNAMEAGKTEGEISELVREHLGRLSEDEMLDLLLSRTLQRLAEGN